MTLLATAAALAMATVLLWAATEKARDPAPTAAAIRSLARNLKLPRGIAWPAALFITAAEIVVALAVLFRPDAALTQLGIVLLAGLFALAGLIALRLDEPVRCNCFGTGGKGRLGTPQLIALLPWLAGAAILRLGIQEAPPSKGAAGFAAISLALAAVRGSGVWKARREARGDRRSAQEMYVWLRSR